MWGIDRRKRRGNGGEFGRLHNPKRPGLLPPTMKCRGREYLCIIFGPHCTLPGNLERLHNRGLPAKRPLALREFSLGVVLQ